jgi:uncharacterized coiled-coil DUF342 family protein
MSRDEERDQVERKMIEMQGSINRLREERDKLRIELDALRNVVKSGGQALEAPDKPTR